MSADEQRSWLAPVAVRAGTLSVAGEPIPITDRRQSAISLLAVAAWNVGLLDVDPMYWGITATREITLRRGATFDLVATSDVQTALGLTGTYTGQSSYTAASAALATVVPTGLRLDGPVWSSEGYRPTDESGAAVGARETGATGSLLIDVSCSDAWVLEYTLRGQVLDVAHAGRWAGRVRVNGVTKQRQGLLDSIVTLTCDVQGVA